MSQKSIGLLTTLSFILAAGVLAQKSPVQDSFVSNVSLIRVIANPNDFNNKRIRIIGYLDYNGLDKSVGIYFCEPDGRHSVVSNSVDLKIEESRTRGMIGKYVVFSGTFHAPDPRWGYNGHFDEIIELKPWTIDVVN